MSNIVQLNKLLDENEPDLEVLLKSIIPHTYNRQFGALARKIIDIRDKVKAMKTEIRILQAYIEGLEQKTAQQ